MRQFDRDTYRGVKTAFRRLVNAFGKMEAAASETRVNQVSLSNYCSLNAEQDKCFAPIDVVIDLMKASGDTRLLDHLASIFDKEVIDKPTGEAGQQAQKINSAIKEMAEAIAATSDDCDLEKKLKELREASQAIADLVASFESADVAGGA